MTLDVNPIIPLTAHFLCLYGDQIKESTMTHESPQPSIKIALGRVLVEYSGSQSFIENGLLELVESMIQASVAAPEARAAENEQANQFRDSSKAGEVQHMSTNTIASQIGAKSGPELLIAAVTHVQLVQKKDKVHRKEIAAEMKKATTFYKNTFTSNLSAYLDGLVKAKRLNLVGDKIYALTASERQKMESALAAA